MTFLVVTVIQLCGWFILFLNSIQCLGCDINSVENAALHSGFCAFYWATGLHSPRGLRVATNNDILVVETGLSQITVFWEDPNTQTVNSAKLASAPGLNHGIDIHGGYLYASSSTTVYRWRYVPGDRRDLGPGEVVIQNIPSGGHPTRTILFGPDEFLYLSIGSAGNVDSSSIRARVWKFDVKNASSLPLDYSSGILFADGLRNEVGLRFDRNGKLWGVENGCDNLYRSDLGGDIHEDNPSEELNLLLPENSNKHYGYPYCWSEGLLDHPRAGGPGTQWAHPYFMNDGIHNDSWCRTNVIKPHWNLPAHTAPLDLLFYYGNTFPLEYKGNAFVTLHGSWDRTVPDGYRVELIRFNAVGEPYHSEPFFAYQGPGSKSPQWPHRPVAIDLGKCVYGDCLYITSDASNVIIAIGYPATPVPISPSNSFVVGLLVSTIILAIVCALAIAAFIFVFVRYRQQRLPLFKI